MARTTWLAVFLLSTPASSARALAPLESTTHFLQRAIGDFDRDGRPDTAGGALTAPGIVRIVLSSRGIQELAQP